MLHCVLADDEALARRLLTDFIAKVPSLQLTAACSNALEVQQLLTEQSIDLLFLDIQMPDLTGIDFLRSLKNPPLTILTTAYAQHALEGYQLNVIDYLLKPFPFERFFKAVSRAIELHSAPTAATLPAESPNYLFVKSGFELVKVDYNDILFIEAMSEYACIYTPKQKIMTLVSLQKCAEWLPSDRFVRIHRSYIVALDHIERVQNNHVRIGAHELSIGKSYKNHFLEVIGGRVWG